MDIERWFETMPPDVVNDIAREKRFIMFAIHDAKALHFARQDYLIKDILTMSRKVKNARQITQEPVISGNGTGKTGKSSGRKTRWASADIRNREDKAAVRELSKNPNFVLDTIVELVDSGYDLNIKRADEGATVRSMLFCNVQGDLNDGGGLSADAPDAWLSLTALVYKHVTLLDGNWFDRTSEGDEDDGWK